MNQLEIEDVQFRLTKSLTMANYSHTAFRDDKFKIQWEQITNRDGHGKTGKPKNYFFIDDMEREFTDLQVLVDCWNERNNFDDPNNEIVWVKKVVPTIKLKPRNKNTHSTN